MKDALVRSWGVPPYLFRHRPFDVLESVGRFSIARGRETVSFSPDEQRKMLADLFSNPFEPGRVFCLCSEHDDLSAKLAALALFRRVAAKGSASGVRWHTVYGGIGDDKFLASSRETESLLPKDRLVVFSNVLAASTALKKERLTDLMEANGGASVVLATTGESPLHFMRSMGRHATGCAWFPAGRTVSVV